MIATLFSNSGITIKRKQPVAYCFVKGNLVTEMFQQMLFNITRALKKYYLSDLALVCDQKSRHRASCKQLGIIDNNCSFKVEDGNMLLMMQHT